MIFGKRELPTGVSDRDGNRHDNSPFSLIKYYMKSMALPALEQHTSFLRGRSRNMLLIIESVLSSTVGND